MSFPLTRVSASQNFPFPNENETVYENPPCLVWVPIKGEDAYTVTVKNEAGETIFQKTTAQNYAYDRKVWDSGVYYWNIRTASGEARGEMCFQISRNAVIVERPDAKTVFESIPAEIRPRHLFYKEDIPALLAAHARDFEILRRNVEMAYRHGLPTPPKFHRDGSALPYREYFGDYRDYCDRDLIACCLMYALTGDPEAGAYAKELFLTICDFNPLGPCSLCGEWGDEVGLSNARCLPAALDMLYPLLNEKQRKYAAATVALYAKQCEERIAKINYAENPSNSHVGRLPAYLGEAALVLKGTGVENDETLIRWLDTALDIYNGIFPFYGCRDGSWAEGAFYSTSYTKWFLPFFSAVERFSGQSLFTRPFYMRYTQYLLHFCNEAYENHPFGDGYWCRPTDAEWPGFFAQNPYRVYAELFGPSPAERRMKEISETDYFRLHLLDIFLPKPNRTFDNPLTGEAENCALFPEGGFAAMHTDMTSPTDLCVLMRASRYTADSHRHADQGSFALYYGGQALVTPSGYFGRRYGSRHHAEWTRQTIAHNVALIDGEGQKKGIEAVGCFTRFDKENRIAVMDITAAYEHLTKYERSIALDEDGITVTDLIESAHPVAITYPIHTLAMPQRDGDCVTVSRERCGMKIAVLAGDLVPETITDQYDIDLNEGEPEAYRVTMPPQYHIYYRAKPSNRHLLKVRFSLIRDDNHS